MYVRIYRDRDRDRDRVFTKKSTTYISQLHGLQTHKERHIQILRTLIPTIHKKALLTYMYL